MSCPHIERHPDIVKLLCDDAPVLLPTLLSRLMWRSHMTEGGLRRVHYFVKYLLINHDGRHRCTQLLASPRFCVSASSILKTIH
eukprot:3346179-Amphidinium_carterae.1